MTCHTAGSRRGFQRPKIRRDVLSFAFHCCPGNLAATFTPWRCFPNRFSNETVTSRPTAEDNILPAGNHVR